MAEPLDPIAVDALLERLSSDDAFRALFASSPEEAVRQLPGKPIEVPPGEPGSSCMRVNQLADKDRLRQTLAQVREQLLGKSSFIPHILE